MPDVMALALRTSSSVGRKPGCPRASARPRKYGPESGSSWPGRQTRERTLGGTVARKGRLENESDGSVDIDCDCEG